jgi:hypothetical protein
MGRRKLRQFWWVFPIGRRKCLGRWKLVSRLLPRRPTHTRSSPLSCHAPTEISLDAALARRHRHMPSPRATAKRCYLLTPAREDASRPPRIATRARPALTPPAATILDAPADPGHRLLLPCAFYRPGRPRRRHASQADTRSGSASNARPPPTTNRCPSRCPPPT